MYLQLKYTEYIRIADQFIAKSQIYNHRPSLFVQFYQHFCINQTYLNHVFKQYSVLYYDSLI